jgi:hypothetical protein
MASFVSREDPVSDMLYEKTGLSSQTESVPGSPHPVFKVIITTGKYLICA